MSRTIDCVAWGLVAAGLLCAVGTLEADPVFKANNTLPLNDPLSWEGGVVPGADDLAVFDERVTTNTLSFLLTNNLSWAGVVFTNQTATPSSMVGTAVLTTNGANAAILTLGAGGVCMAGAGLALALNVPLALGAAQTWQLDRRNLIFSNTVSGASDWTLNMASQTYWYAASGYSGNLAFTNSPSNATAYFYTTGRWAKSLSGDTARRFELRHSDTALWSTLFSARTATVNYWMGLENRGTLQFETGDTLSLPNNYLALDLGNVVQNGGDVNVRGLFLLYNSGNGARYTVNGGTLSVGSSGLDLGDSLWSVSSTARVFQVGGTVGTPNVKIGRSNLGYYSAPVYEMTGGVFRITGTRGADTGIHLSWNSSGTSGAECSGAFLMEGGWADADQIAFGRSEPSTTYGVTNAFSLFKMTGGELVLGTNGIYASRSWNNGITNSGYAVKLGGGTLTAGDSWTSPLDIRLDDRNGGIAFNTSDTNGNPCFVTLNGAVYGSGSLTKRGAGTLLLAGEASYSGKTVIKAGTLRVGGKGDVGWWRADALTGTNLSPVTAWLDQSSGAQATSVDALHAPCLVTNALNGHSVVRFTNTSVITQYLSVAASASPISGATNFSIVVVFKATGTEVGSTGAWYYDSGLVDAEQGGVQNDWGMVCSASGCVGGGAGFYNYSDTTVYSSSSYPVTDGNPHVAIYTLRGTNLTMNVDGRVTTAVSTYTNAATNSRNVYRFLIGSMNNLYYFNGDMAEIRIYRNRALTLGEQNALGGELASTYGVSGAVFETDGASFSDAAGVVAVSSTSAYSALPYNAAVWDADTLSGTNGRSVSAWSSTNGVLSATLSDAGVSGATAPVLLKGAINGHNAVRFTGSQKSVLGISAAQSPIAGVTNFSIAFAFRTDTPGRTADQWYNNVGVIDAEQAGATYDWGVGFTGDGRVAGGIGNSDSTTFSKPFDLCDGFPHVAVISYDAIGSNTLVTVDGLSARKNVGSHAAPRNTYRVLIGSLNALSGQYFTGDLAGFRFYPNQALTEAEMTSLSAELAATYGVRFISRIGVASPQPTGVGTGDVQVCSGATLDLPSVTNAPVTLVSGQTISGGGTVCGTLALASGAAVEIGLTNALTIDRLVLDSGAVVRWNHEGNSGLTLSVGTLKTAGAAIVEVVGGVNLPARIPFLSYDSGENLAGAEWTVTGGRGNTCVEVNTSNQTLDLVTHKGTVFFVR